MKYSNPSTLNHTVTVINSHPTSQLVSDRTREFASRSPEGCSMSIQAATGLESGSTGAGTWYGLAVAEHGVDGVDTAPRVQIGHQPQRRC